jgi:hypothetical protein
MSLLVISVHAEMRSITDDGTGHEERKSYESCEGREARQ